MRRRVFCILLLVFLVLLSNQPSLAILLPRAKVTIRVVDEDRNPVEGASVGIGFERNTGWGVKEIGVDGVSNREGIFTGSAFAMDHLGFTITKDGYYRSTGEYTFEQRKLGRWIPWNPVLTVELRKVVLPVPMYARDTKLSRLSIPAVGEEVAFDLMKYDWLPPHGSGIEADFVFRLERRFVSIHDFDASLFVTFKNPSDGISLTKEDRGYGSDFKLSRYAPQGGYEPELVKTISVRPGTPIRTDFEEDRSYYFRIRSVQEGGIIKRAMYGKIHGDIQFYPEEEGTAKIHFTYYLNPDYTRNLEFDPTRNLFKNLKRSERVGIR